MYRNTEHSACKKGKGFLFFILIIFSLILFAFPGSSFARLYLDINAPEIQKFRIAIPDFNDISKQNRHPEISQKLTKVIANDLDLSGYFSLIDKEAFLAGQGDTLTPGNIRFKDWTVIGAELLLVGKYTLIGKSLEVEMRLYDVFSGRQILGKRAFGEKNDYRYLVHRLSNEILTTLTGHAGIFLTKIAYVSNNSKYKEIFICDYDGYGPRQITKDKSIAMLPRLSPDGKKVAYSSYKEGGQMLYVKDLISGRTNRLSGRSGMNTGASWSPGGKTIALTMSRKGNPDIYMMSLTGRVLEKLTTYWGIDVSPTFSPDGNKMAFVSNRSGAPQIYVLDRVTGKEERISFNGKYNTSPSWSSLNRIAFVSLVDGGLNIYSMTPDGNQLKRLTENHGKNEDPCWSPGGRYIVFSSNRTGQYKLYIMNANGQNQNRITFSRGNHTSPSWAP